MSKQKAELLKLSKNFRKSSDKARAKEQWPPVFLCQTMHDLIAVFELNLKNLASLLAKSGADTLSLLERRLLAAAQT